MKCGGSFKSTGKEHLVGLVIVRGLKCRRCGRVVFASDAARVTTCDDALERREPVRG